MSDVPALQVDDLYKSFGANQVLSGVSLTAHKGDVISILGSSGSGKSTFLRCINLLEIPSAGEVRIAGELIAMRTHRRGERLPADDKQVQRLRAKLAMVFQSFNLWSHMTVLQNIIEAPVHVLGVPRAEAISRAEALLQRVGLYERRDYYPGHLSGGQQQRVAIARALAKNPKLLLCDEPTGALDYETGKAILKLLQDCSRKRGMTVVIITHNQALTAMADRIIKVKSGKIASVKMNEQIVPVEEIEW